MRTKKVVNYGAFYVLAVLILSGFIGLIPALILAFGATCLLGPHILPLDGHWQ